MYISTRSGERLTASQAILKGLSSDGGLFLPERIEKLNLSDSYYGKSYREIARDVFKIFLDDFSDSEIDCCISSAYDRVNFREKFVGLKSFGNLNFLELYHGPTLAFKDMALTILPFLIDVATKISDFLSTPFFFFETSIKKGSMVSARSLNASVGP